MRHIFLLILLIYSKNPLEAQQKICSEGYKGTNISFTENKGQVADQNGKARNDVRFIVSAGGIKIFIAQSGLHYQWHKSAGISDKAGVSDTNAQSYRVDVNLLNALSNPQVITEGASDYYTNYYLAHCPQGITHVRNYNKVTLRNVYPDIDWVFYTIDNTVEYDFFVHPGGNPSDIAMQVEGATDLRISSSGSLLLTSPFGTCEQLAPVAFQEGKPLNSKFVLNGNIVRLTVDDYNPGLALNIDPVIKIWGTYYGDTGDETVTDLKTDNSGNVYMAGYTTSTSNISSGGHQTTYGNGITDGFLVKFDGAGNRLWATYYGGDSTDYVYGCATDPSGNVYISGTTMSATAIAFNGFKNSVNSYPGTNYGSDAFLVKFNSSGVRQWGTYLGGVQANYSTGSWEYSEKTDYGFGCATDLNGNVFMTGLATALIPYCYDPGGNPLTCQNTYISTPGTYQDTMTYWTLNPFLIKFDGNGVRLWATYYGGADTGPPGPQEVYCATDRLGNAYLAGTTDPYYNGPSLSFNGHQDTMRSPLDGWVAKFDPNGTTRLWGTYYGGYADEQLTGLCTDSIGNVYIAGITESTNNGNVIATPGAERTYLSSTQDAFLVKLNAAGTRQWGTYYGDLVSSSEREAKVTTDNTGRVLLSAYTHLISNTVGFCGYNQGWSGAGMYVARFGTDGTRDWAESFIQDYQIANTKNAYCATIPSGKRIFLADYNNVYSSTIPQNGQQNNIAGGYDAALVCFVDTPITDTICGYVFDDQNGNGVQDFGEGYLNNIEVYMAIPQGVQIYRAYSNAQGYYELIVPQWGTTGYCNTPLMVYIPSTLRKVVSIPLSGNYPASVLGNSPACVYNFGLAPSIKITGNVYYDNNHNGSLNFNDPGIVRQSVSFNAQRQAYTDGNGDYTAIIPVGNYTETFDKLDAYATSTSNPVSYTINGTTPGSTFTSKNFGAYFTPSFINSSVESWRWGIPPVVGQTCDWLARVTNLGTLSTTDTLIFHYDSLLIYTGSLTTIDTVGHTITRITNNIVPARYSDYTFSFLVPPTVPAGTILHNWVEVSPTSQPDTDLSNNRDDDYSMVLASFDPNNKISETNTPDPTQHIARYWSNGDDYIRYTINFQNTGTYTAFNVVINDTLPAQVDASTVEVLRSSHSCVVNRSVSALNFKFSNINLPDSATNEPASKGYVVFKVKPSTSSYPGDSIVNRAAIYFDYNSAVLTEKNVVQLIGTGPCQHTVDIHKYDTVCNWSYLFNNRICKGSGIYYGDTLYASNNNECNQDTILHLWVDVDTLNYSTGLDCKGRLVPWGLITQPGIYYDTICDANGCLTLYKWSLDVSPYAIRQNVTLCSGDSIYFNGIWRKARGYYYDTLTASCGLDSIIMLDLSLYDDPIRVSITAYKCPGDTFHFGNRDIVTAGYNYYDTTYNAGFCGQTKITRLFLYDQTFNNPYNLNVTINQGETYAYNGVTYSNSGTYTIILPGAARCGRDSTIVLSITKRPTTPFTIDWTGSRNTYDCATDSGSYLIVTPKGGQAPYTYRWSTGDTTRWLLNPPPGSYQITVTSQHAPGTWFLFSAGVYYSTFNYAFEEKPLCSSTDSNGILKVGLYWGYYTQLKRFPYTVYLTQGSLRDTAVINYPDTMCIFTGLRYGGASLAISDSTGCFVPHFYYTNDPFIDTVAINTSIVSLSPDHCSSDSLALHVSKYWVDVKDSTCSKYYYNYVDGNSALPYNISYVVDGVQHLDTFRFIDNYGILPNLTSGTFVTISDGNGCSKAVEVPPLGFEISHSNVPILPCATQHLLSIAPTSGTPPYNFLWSTGETNDTILTSAPGNYSVQVSDASGCNLSDTIAIQPPVTVTHDVTASVCNNDSFNFNGTLLSTAGIYSDTLLTSAGCDSIVTLYLSILPVNGSSISASICQGNTYSFHGQSLTQPGSYSSTFTNSNGCDSVVALSLTVLPTSATPISASICSGEIYTFNGQQLTQSGSYSAILTNSNGCDSTVTLSLNTLTTSITPISAHICAGDSYDFYGQQLTISGNYSATLTNSNGCDSILTLSLSTLATSATQLSASICAGDSLNFNGQLLSQSGTYLTTLTNSRGCDSIVTLSFSIMPNSDTSFQAVACADSSYNFYGQILTQPGTYTTHLSSGNGCDSIITLHFNMLPALQPTITRIGDTLYSSEALSYQWILNNNSIQGGNESYLVVTENGQYQVAVIDSNGCHQNSIIYRITGVGLTGIDGDFFARVYPNPSTERITIETNIARATISLLTVQGQLINEFFTVQPQSLFDISALSPAVYLVKIVSRYKTVTLKFLKN